MLQKTKELEIGGLSFGLTSGVITTLGMIVGLDSATNGSKLAIIAAILTVAIADSLSDALGIHLSEESRLDEKKKPVWAITLFTFIGKFVFSIIFILPVIFLNGNAFVYASILLGLLLIMILAAFVARRRKVPVTRQILGHAALAILVIVASYFIGRVAAYLS